MIFIQFKILTYRKKYRKTIAKNSIGILIHLTFNHLYYHRIMQNFLHHHLK
jgi:hypothetical protein